jgi:hypothetical protein
LSSLITWHPTSYGIIFFLHFIFCFVKKASRWWGVTRFAQPHVHMYMFCSYVITTLYHLLEELQMWTFLKDTFLMQFFSQLYT